MSCFLISKPTLFDIPNPPAKVGSKRRKLHRTDAPPARHGIKNVVFFFFFELINALQMLKIFLWLINSHSIQERNLNQTTTQLVIQQHVQQWKVCNKIIIFL